MKFFRLTPALLALMLAYPACAADHYGRLTVDVKVEGSGKSQRNRDYANSITSQNMHLAFSVKRPDGADAMNLQDHAGNAAAMGQQMEASRARAPSQEKQKEYMERMQKQAAACNNNLACMQEIALKVGRETASWSAPPPNTSADEGRYFNYVQVDPAACRAEFTARINDSVEGAYSDVAGMRPFTSRTTADFKAGELEKATVCVGGVTVDTRTGKLTANVSVPIVKGQYRATDGGRVTNESKDAQTEINADALKWAMAQVNAGGRSGSQRTTLRLPTPAHMVGKGEQVLNVEVRWSFDGK